MPELPEVETTRRGIEPLLLNRAIKQVIVNRHDLRVPIPAGFGEALAGRVVESTLRRGKYIIVYISDGSGFVLHLGMSGRLTIHESKDRYEPQKHDHVVFEMDGGARIVFSDPRRFGMLYLTTQAGWADEKPFKAMGPEPLGNDFNGPALVERLAGKRVNVKNALLDQRVVAGVGNIYACEALYEARMSPLRAVGSVRGEEAERLAGAVRDVLERAIEAGGSSLKDFQHADGQLGYFQHSFSVYDREGQPCRACSCAKDAVGCIKRIVQSGRSTFYCPVRQV